MDVSKSLIALGVSAALGIGSLSVAVAQTGDREDSVRSWGRWAVLSPAAGGEEYVGFAPAGTNDLERCEAGANCPGPNPPVPPEPPVVEGPCVAGAPCGFAYIDNIISGEGQGEDSHIGKFELTFTESQSESGEGTGVEPAAVIEVPEGPLNVAFRVTPIPTGTGTVISSDTLPVLPLSSGFRSNDRDSRSFVNGRVTAVEGEVDPTIIEGFWRQNSADGGSQQNGEYVLGIAATGTEMADLFEQLREIRGEAVGVYAGPTGRGGDVALYMNFDRAVWEGEFNGQQVGFAASGAIVGSGFVSDAGGFSENIASGLVEGGFVNAGQNAIGAFEVTDLEGLHDADIFNAGLQRDVYED